MEKEVKEMETRSELNKKKKWLIYLIAGLSLIIVAIIVAILLLTNNDKKITISFDTDGAKNISEVKISKGGSVKLPKIKKSGFIFDGWYLDDQRVTDSTIYEKDVTLKAKWISENVKIFKVTFDSDGGSKVDSLMVECGKELSLPESPTKSGYSFISWIDKNETPILDKALLSCEDITLKANWEKEEIKNEETKPSNNNNKPSQNTSSQPEKNKTYTCPDGYSLSGTKCVLEINAVLRCPQGTHEDGDLCVDLNDKIEANYSCPERQISLLDSVVNETGILLSYPSSITGQNVSICGYHKLDYSTDVCESNGAYLIGNSCYASKFQPQIGCSNQNYTDYSTENIYKKFGVNATQACYKVYNKAYKCPDGYTTSAATKCTKIINATAN